MKAEKKGRYGHRAPGWGQRRLTSPQRGPRARTPSSGPQTAASEHLHFKSSDSFYLQKQSHDRESPRAADLQSSRPELPAARETHPHVPKAMTKYVNYSKNRGADRLPGQATGFYSFL